MTDELTQREAEHGGSPGEGGLALCLLEAVRRVHGAADESAFGAAVLEAFSALLGSAPDVIRIVHEVAVSRRFGAGVAPDGADGLMDRAALESLPALDGHPPRGVALPIPGPGRALGAIYIGHSGAWTHGGIALDLLKALAAHAGAASIDLARREAPADPLLAAGAVRPTLSLRDAKLVFELRLLQLRLAETKGNVAATARSLDMDRGQLSRLMRKHHIERTAFRRRKG